MEIMKENEAIVNAGIRGLETALRNMLKILSDPELYTADHGKLIPSALWKVGRVNDPKLFQKEIFYSEPSIAVDLLIDASGSQQKREAMVALQSYMFSAALSRVGITHRVMSYCTYGDHTVIRRFRDYADGPDTDIRILEYHAGSNNRDGLAIAAAGSDLLKRKEDRRILVVLSDGLPNDMTAGRASRAKHPKYVGNVAIKDTCFQLRMLKRHGIETLGIFLGDDEELGNERYIFGSSFLHIRRAEDFSGSASRRLSEMLTR
jgi:nitric oxide reductase activation protein